MIRCQDDILLPRSTHSGYPRVSGPRDGSVVSQVNMAKLSKRITLVFQCHRVKTESVQDALRGFPQVNPIGICVGTNQDSSRTSTFTESGGTSDINALTLLMITIPCCGNTVVFTSPPTGFYAVDSPIGSPARTYSYLPRSSPVPAASMSGTVAIYRAGMQATILPDAFKLD